MSSSFERRLVYIFLFAFLIPSSFAQRESGGRELREDKRWQDIGNGVENHNSANENSITQENVNSTSTLWTFNPSNAAGEPYPPSFDSQPAYFDGMAYFADSLGRIYSVYGSNGSTYWMVNVSTGNTMGTIEAFRQTPYVDSIRVCIAARNVFCVQRANGAVIWKQSNSGDTTSIGPDGNLTDYYTTAGQVGSVDGRLFVPHASLQNEITTDQLVNQSNTDLTARGGVSAFNLLDGTVQWRFYTTSDQTAKNPQYGAGQGVYGGVGIDVFTRTIFFGSGQAYEPPSSPLSDSLIALDYVTGQFKFSYQATAGDVFGRLYPDGPDHDVNTHAQIFEVVAKRPGVDAYPKIYRVVGIGSKDGVYRLFETVQNGTNATLLAAVQVDPPSPLGGFQGTPAFHNGVLYCATFATINSTTGARVPTDITTLMISIKTTAIDVQALLEGRNYTIWTVQDPNSFLNIAFADVTYSEGVVYVTSFNGIVRGFASNNGTLVFTRTPVPGGFMVFPGFSIATPIHSGVTIVDGKLLVGFGSSFMTNVIGGIQCYGFPYRYSQSYNVTVPPPTTTPQCTLGYQQCTSDGKAFQTCAYTDNAGDTGFGAVQSCPSGTSCHVYQTNYVNCN